MTRSADHGFDRRTFLRLAAMGAGTVALSSWPVGPAGAGEAGEGGVVSGVAVGRRRSVAVGQDGAGRAAVWWADASGAWRPATAPPPAPAVLGDVTAVGDGFVAVGSVSGSPTTWSSVDGTSWRRGAVLAGPGHLVAAAASQDQVLAAGALTDGETGEGVAPLLVAVDGAGTTRRVASGGIGPLPHGSLTAVGRQANLWVVAGLTAAVSRLWTLEDGGRWASHPDGASEPVAWSSLLTVGGELLALGTSVAAGDVLLSRSRDGRDWRLDDVPTALAQLGVDLRATANDLTSGVITAGTATGALVRGVLG